ncbi:MAG TPA: LPS assembly protein LptD [Caulobacteraceae bacterium]|nr:LPS assembly protein LptD [Caulobacteraceae bacterium]
MAAHRDVLKLLIGSILKQRLLCGAAVIGMSCAAQAALVTPALAQTAVALAQASPVVVQTAAKGPVTADDLVRAAAAAPTPPPAEQVLGDNAFYIEANTMIRDDQAKTWTAKGSVEARYDGRTLRADVVVYDAKTDVTTARGNVQIVNADGTYEYAQAMTLDKGFHTGVALAFSTHETHNVTLAASEAIRRDRDAMELNRAVFTACDICAKDLTPKQPTWSIQAAHIVQDPALHLVYYRDAVIRVEGVPVIYTPVFWHPDPTAKRASGFLEPSFSADSRKGFSYTQPYLWVISPSQELIVAPQFNTKVNPLLELEYRERFYSGEIDARVGYTDEREFDNNGAFYDYNTSRSYILAEGAFAPTANWTWGFSAERVTDPLMFQRYAINNVYEQRSLYPTDNLRLISQLFAAEQTQNSYVSISTMSFQGLIPGDQNGTFPVVAPLIEAHYQPAGQILGGTLRLLGDAVLLDRAREIATDNGPNNGSERATVSADWTSSISLANGMRFQPFANARFDEYNVYNQTSTALGDHTTERVLGTIGVDASYPFFKRQGDMTIVLEPLAQLAISPSPRSYGAIPNEDSQTLSFDETNLFDYNKSAGFDYYEAGQRLNFGGRATVRLDSGGSAQVVVGESLRAEPDPSLAGTSLNRTASDWVFAVSVQPVNQFSAYTRALINQQDGEIDRIESGANISLSMLSGYIRYLRDTIDAVGTRTENMQVGGQLQITPHWGLTTGANLDIANNVWATQSEGLFYQDECIRVELDYNRNGTYNRALGPSNTVLVRITLPLLGGRPL